MQPTPILVSPRRRRPASALVSSLALAFIASAAVAKKAPDDLAILKAYAADFAKDPSLDKPVVFGVTVGEAFFTIDAAPATNGAAAHAEARSGAPATPSFYYKIESSEWLGKLHRGEINALTSMAKAFETDSAPMDIDVMEGFAPPENFGDEIIPFTFHFWTKGSPEIVPFGAEMTRFTHGANAGVFYYQRGLRSAWFEVRPGQHVNENEKSRENPFPSMFILIEGELTALVGGVETTFKAGTLMFVPAGVSHEFINNTKKSALGFLFMFGEGA